MGRIGAALASSKLPANRLLLLDFSLPGFSRSFRLKGNMVSADRTLLRRTLSRGDCGALFPAAATFFH